MNENSINLWHSLGQYRQENPDIIVRCQLSWSNLGSYDIWLTGITWPLLHGNRRWKYNLFHESIKIHPNDRYFQYCMTSLILITVGPCNYMYWLPVITYIALPCSLCPVQRPIYASYYGQNSGRMVPFHSCHCICTSWKYHLFNV
jgi:hypothetical protein